MENFPDTDEQNMYLYVLNMYIYIFYDKKNFQIKILFPISSFYPFLSKLK